MIWRLIRCGISTLETPAKVFLMREVSGLLLREDCTGVITSRQNKAECVVFGIPDDRLGEELAMVVYCGPNQALTSDQVRVQLQQSITGYKVPRYIRIHDRPLLKGATEKFDKRAIREVFIAEQD